MVAVDGHLSCELCGISFPRPSALTQHMQANHDPAIDPGNGLFECENCRRSFFSAGDLDRHGRRMHRY